MPHAGAVEIVALFLLRRGEYAFTRIYNLNQTGCQESIYLKSGSIQEIKGK